MKNFTVQVDYEGRLYECFVQKLKNRQENVYIINFCDNTLIKQYQGKRIVLCAQRLNLHQDNHVGLPAGKGLPVFEANLWKAIWQSEGVQS